MPGKIGIRIPSHNSLTVSFLDELLQTATNSRGITNAKKIRLRLPEKYHVAIVSTGLSYLAYLGAFKKVQNGYKLTSQGKKIGKLLLQDRVEEANFAWSEMLKRHRLYRVFVKYLSTRDSKQGILEEFSLYLRKRAHAKWKISAIRSRVSRLCELFAEKGLIEYQDGNMSLPETEDKENETLSELPHVSKPMIALTVHTPEKRNAEATATKPSQTGKTPISIAANSWPLRIEIKLEISDKATTEVINAIFSHIKDLQRTVYTLSPTGHSGKPAQQTQSSGNSRIRNEV